MTPKMFRHSVLPLSLCATSVALGQTPTVPPAAAPAETFTPLIQDPQPVSPYRIRMGYQLGFNIKTTFKHIGRFAAATNPGSTNGLSNHVYDDGYNAVDTTTNAHFNGSGFTQGTWNWGFSNNGTPDVDGNGNQVHGNGTPDGTIDFHSLSSAGGSTGARQEDSEPGFMLTFSREFLHDEKDRWRAGLEWAFGYTDYTIDDSQIVNAKGSQLTDTYSLFGNNLPVAGAYSQGPGGAPNHIIIGDTPTRSVSSAAIPVSGTRSFGADIFAFRLGPYFEIPLNKTFSLSLEGGAALVYVYSKFQFHEQVVTPSGLLDVAGNGNHSDILPGGYAGAQISAALNDQWSLFAGAQWQDVGTYVHSNHATGESAVLDLSQAIFFSAGVGYSF
jgi:hypothetical protein